MSEADKIIVEFVADTTGLEPAYKAFSKLGLISEDALKKFLADNVKIQQGINKAATEAQTSIKKLSDGIKDVGKNAATAIVLDKSKDVVKTVVAVQSMKQQLREATKEAQNLAAEYGNVDERAVAAAKKAALLKKQIGDTGDVIKALNPEAKFNSIIQLGGAIAGAFGGAQAALALFGGESELAKKAAENFQKTIAISQGLNSILSLKEAFTVLKSQIVASAAAAQAKKISDQSLAVAEGEVAAATVANTEAEEASIVVKEEAIVVNQTLGASLYTALGPLGLILLAIAAVTAGIVIYNAATDDTIEKQEKLKELSDDELAFNKEVLDVIKRKNSSIIAEAENTLKVAEAEGVSNSKRLTLIQGILSAKKEALNDEIRANENTYQQLLKIDALKAEAFLISVKDRTEAIKNEQKQIIADEKVNTANEIERQKQLQETISKERIANIADSRTKELAGEREALQEKLRVLLKDETENAERIKLAKEASEKKLAAIRFKFDKEELDVANKLQIAKTLEGTEGRLDAEEQAAIRLRNLQVTEAGKTTEEIALIEKELDNTINAIELKRLQLRQQLNKARVDNENETALALLNARKNIASTPQQELAAEKEILQENLRQKIAAIDTENENEISLANIKYDNLVRLASGNKEEIKRINDERNAEIEKSNSKADAKGLEAATEYGKNLLAIDAKGAAADVALENKKQQLKRQILDSALSASFDVFKSNISAEVSEIEEQKKNEADIFDKALEENQARVDKEIISRKEGKRIEKQLLEEKQKAEEAAAKKLADLKRKADLADRAQRLFQIAVSTARNAIEQPGPLGALVPYWIALGAIETATVLATPLPKYAKGTLSLQRGNNRSGVDTIPILANEGEAITPTKQAREYRTTLEAIHGSKIPSFILNDFVRNYTVKEFPTFQGNVVHNSDIDSDELADKIGNNIVRGLSDHKSVMRSGFKRLHDALENNTVNNNYQRRA